MIAATDDTRDTPADNVAAVVPESSENVSSLSKAEEETETEDCELAEEVVDMESATPSPTHPPLAASGPLLSVALPLAGAAGDSATGACVPSSPSSCLAPSISARCDKALSSSSDCLTAADLSSLPAVCSREADDGVVTGVSYSDSVPESSARSLAVSRASGDLVRADGEKNTAPAPIRRSLLMTPHSSSPPRGQHGFTKNSKLGVPCHREPVRAKSSIAFPAQSNNIPDPVTSLGTVEPSK